MLLLPLNGGWGNKGCTYSQSLKEETKTLLDCDTWCYLQQGYQGWARVDVIEIMLCVYTYVNTSRNT